MSAAQAAWTAAVAVAMPSGGSTGVPIVGPERDSDPDIANSTGSVADHDERGPVAPKSVIDNATRRG